MNTMRVLLPAALTLLLGGCELVGDVFKAGMWVGVLVVVAIVVAIGFIMSKMRK